MSLAVALRMIGFSGWTTYDDAVIQLEFDSGGIEIIYLSGRFKAYTYNDH